MLTVVLSIGVFGRIIGRDYGASGWEGLGILGLYVVLVAVACLTVYLAFPFALNVPAIDTWFTNQILNPLGLA